MKNIDKSVIMSVSLILIIQFILSRILAIPVFIILFNIYALEDPGLTVNIISVNIIFISALILSSLIVQKQIDRKNIVKISGFVALIIFEFAIIKFFVNKNIYDTIQLMIQPVLAFIVLYIFLKIIVRKD